MLKEKGTFVEAGEAIAIIGNTGTLSSGPHLHFEIWKGGRSIDPLIYFPEYKKKDLTFKLMETLNPHSPNPTNLADKPEKSPQREFIDHTGSTWIVDAWGSIY